MASDSEDSGKFQQKYQDQPYDESLDVPDTEDVPSVATPNPFSHKGPTQNPAAYDDDDDDLSDDSDDDDFGGGMVQPPPLQQQQLQQQPPQGLYGDPSKMGDSSEEDDDDEDDFYQEQGDGEDVLRMVQQRMSAHGGRQQQQGAFNAPPMQQMKPQKMPGQEGDSGSSGEDDDDDDEDEDGDSGQMDGAYDPSEFDNLAVTPEIKELFQYITRFTPQLVDLDYKLKPFIPDYIPAVGDIDAMIKVARPDQKVDSLGLTVLDEPCAKQSDPTVLDLQLRAFTKQTVSKQAAVKMISNAEKNPKAIASWVSSIQDLHRSKPPATVHYTRPMPDIDTLMAEWPPEFEEFLKDVTLPNADMDCDLETFADICCSILDIPTHKSRIQALHVMFTLFTEFKNSQHFKNLADNNQLDNRLKQGKSMDDDDDERLVL